MKAFIIAVTLGSFLFAADTPAKLQYTKSFPGSLPAYVSIEVLRTGEGVYKEAPEDDNPVDFKVSAEVVDQIFALTEKLDRFKRPQE